MSRPEAWIVWSDDRRERLWYEHTPLFLSAEDAEHAADAHREEGRPCRVIPLVRLDEARDARTVELLMRDPAPHGGGTR